MREHLATSCVVPLLLSALLSGHQVSFASEPIVSSTDTGSEVCKGCWGGIEDWKRHKRAGMAAYKEGNYAEAAKETEAALRLAEQEFGPNEPRLWRIYKQLGLIYEEQHRDAEAESSYERMRALYARVEEWERYDNAGMTAYKQGNYAEAAKEAEAALHLAQQEFGPNEPRLWTIYRSLGWFYEGQGRYAEAEPSYKRALALYEKHPGRHSASAVADLVNSLAGVYHAQGKYTEAEPSYKRALAIREKTSKKLGHEVDPETSGMGKNLIGLAVLYGDQGRYAEAEPLYKRALAMYEKADPYIGQLEVATSLNGLAVLYYSQGRYAEAEPLCKRALPIYEKMATSLNDLVELYRNQGRYAEAEAASKRALAFDEKVATSLNNLALVYYSQGKYTEAEPLYKRALATYEKALGPEHPNVAMSLENYSAMLTKIGRTSEAAKMEARAKAIRRKHAAVPR